MIPLLIALAASIGLISFGFIDLETIVFQAMAVVLFLTGVVLLIFVKGSSPALAVTLMGTALVLYIVGDSIPALTFGRAMQLAGGGG